MGTRSAAGTISAKFAVEIANLLDAASTGTPAVTLGQTETWSVTTGTTTGKSDRCWSDKGRTITSGNSENIDVYDLAAFDAGAGAGLDALGQAWVLAEVTAIMIKNDAASAGNLIVGGIAATTAWNSMFNGDDDAVLVLKPGDWFVFASPVADPALAVADVSNHLLKMAASGGNVTYDVHILGRSA